MPAEFELHSQIPAVLTDIPGFSPQGIKESLAGQFGLYPLRKSGQSVNLYEFNHSFIKQSVIMGILNQIAQYLFLKKKDPERPDTQWVKYMHGINRISLLLFLVGLIIIIIKLFFRR